ncbi:Rid family hydrolase [Rheinheimera sp. 1928-s]|uniref:Rid family hydrolase n=1 Tax=Rheinheimera sp. 1928-s TaxID=3033803 RepID=UPI0026143589|nr:Rid family hydrolase [Rheinheimera sp. 1928-s]MDF3126802.1 Rid family hydrolase [Rheinheimera sp. 1928-s]
MSVIKTTLLSLTLLSTALMAQSVEEVIPTVDGYVYIDSANAKKAYEEWHYSPARSSGDLVFFSGVIAGAPVEGATPELFKKNLRRAFGNLNTLLKQAGLGPEHVVKINSYHLFRSPLFKGTKEEHIAAVMAVKDEFFKAPYPAWTAVGVAELFADRGLVEIEIIARKPDSKE